MKALAILVLALAVLSAFAGPLIAPQNPFDAGSLDLMDSLQPPFFLSGGQLRFLLGSDAQGRDVLSAILYGARLSILVGVLSVALAVAVGVPLGLAAGYAGGWLDAVLMRIADTQLAFPALLVALLADGVARALLPRDRVAAAALPVLVVAIGLGRWPQFARVMRVSVRGEVGRPYVEAARLMGLPPLRIAFGHVLPNAIGPALVLLRLSLGLAVLDEATLSFLGVGLPPTRPSLGTLIRLGHENLLSGEWWVIVFPALALALPLIAINMLGETRVAVAGLVIPKEARAPHRKRRRTR